LNRHWPDSAVRLSKSCSEAQDCLLMTRVALIMIMRDTALVRHV
jgi:hypothetical protein